MNKAQKKEYFQKVGGRPGISQRVLEIAKEIAEVNSYKRAIIGAGQIRFLAEIAAADDYWDEKQSYGFDTEKGTALGASKAKFGIYGERIFEEDRLEK